MRENRRTLGWLLAAYLFLLLLSAYRQLGLRDLIPGGYHPLAVYLGYTVLLAGWFCALYCRVNPSNLRYYLYAEIAVMLLWEEVRFCQEQFLWKDLYALRVSGYGIAIPLVMVPLLGLYGALVLDKNVDYRIPPRWYLLIIPAAVLILLMLTNEAHHLMFVQASGEIETNLYFHPNWGIYLLALWSGTIEICRVVLIFKKSRKNQDYPRLKFLPFAVALGLLVSVIPYFVASFVVDRELIDLSARLFFWEAMIWESCILLGMIPVNSQYRQVFQRSTVAMRITDKDGQERVSSAMACPLSRQQFLQLKQNNRFSLGQGQELHIHEIQDGYLIWQKDLSEMERVLQELHQTACELEEEGSLLREEIRTKAEKAHVQAQNEIYDQLSTEVAHQRELICCLLRRQQTKSTETTWRQICLVGVYIKRFCNLCLSWREMGTIFSEDLALSLQDMLKILEQMGVTAELTFDPEVRFSPDFSLDVMRALETLLESLDFELSILRLTVNKQVNFEIRTDHAMPDERERERLKQLGCQLTCQKTDGSGIWIMQEGENIHVWQT